MRIPLHTIFELGDLLMLWTCYEVDYNHPLVTSFVAHDAASFRLRVVISISYDAGHLTLLSELLSEDETHTPVVETLTVPLAIAGTFRY